MTALLSKMKETDGCVLTAAESCAIMMSEMFSVALAVKEFAAVMREHKKKNDKQSMAEALWSAEREKWIEIQEQINKLTARGVFHFINKEQLPQGKKAFPLHTVLKHKRNHFG